jgi:hypothetical protein
MKKCLSIFFLSLLLFSCKKEEKPSPLIISNNGFYIINEGNYTWGNSSLSYYDEQKYEIENNVFYNVNQVPLGDVAMDMKMIHGKGFITINNSGIIYVMEPQTAKYVATIGGLTSPRYILPVNDSLAYVTDLYSPYISIINTQTYQKTGQIFIGKSTETMVKWNNELFVTGWSFNNKVYVIDINQHNLIDSITVGLQPNSIAMDKNNNLWVLCDGGYTGNPIGYEKSSLWKINSGTRQVIKSFYLPNLSYAARSLIINNSADTLYFIWHDVYKMSFQDSILPQQPFIAAGSANFYSLWEHPSKPWFIVTDAKNYTSNGDVCIYNLNGTLLEKKQAGIIPRSFCSK